MPKKSEIQLCTDYARIEKAINFLRANFKSPPSLEELANHVHLSHFHFQRLFTEWAGVSPKQFIQFTRLEYAKKVLQESAQSIFETAFETGLSGTGRLHDLFVKIEGMTPGEYKNGGENLTINYSLEESLFGKILIASTSKGICAISFVDDERSGMVELKKRHPNARWVNKYSAIHLQVASIFQNKFDVLPEIKLHIQASEFQLKVWEALLKIPSGKLSTYGQIASYIKNPNAPRAVGTAIGSNPIAFLIPCHRVIQSTGNTGGYMWGHDRKTAILGWEAAKNETTERF
jgi:AraC family transcriptional regulator of adaptative response/methylated-DNA-[protein]-cysteine methyltransferase